MCLIRFVSFVFFVASCAAQAPTSSVDTATGRYPLPPPKQSIAAKPLIVEQCTTAHNPHVRTVEVLHGSAVELVFVHSEQITRLIFSSDIRSAKANEQEQFRISANRLVEADRETPIREVAVMPRPGAKSTILYVQTEEFDVILDLVVVADTVPTHRYVRFVSPGDETLLNRRVARALRPYLHDIQTVEAQYEQAFADFHQIADARARDLVAFTMWQDLAGRGRPSWCRIRHSVTAPEAKVRAGWVRWLGDSLFLGFSIHASRDFELGALTLVSNGIPRPMGVSLRHHSQRALNTDPKGHLVVAGLPEALTYATSRSELRITTNLGTELVLPLSIPGPDCQLMPSDV